MTFDPSDPAFIADPYPTLAALQAAAPIFFHEPSGMWMITRHALVQSTLRDRRLGRDYHHRYTDEELGLPAPYAGLPAVAESERWSLLNLEPPDHTRIRSLVSKVFTPSGVAALRPMIEREASTRLAALVERPTFDLIADYAQPYSVAVICAMLGVPAADTRLLLDWSHAIVRIYELAATDATRAAAEQAAAEFVVYTKALIDERRARPDAALLSQLVAVEEAGEQLTVDEILCTVIVLLNAGHEATVNTLGNGTRALMRHRDEWQQVVDGTVSARTVVEEMIRWDSPLQLFERWVLDEGVEIGGQPLRVGEQVAMLFGAANRDPQHFDDPTRFVAGRGDATHVGFGGGIHFCIGAPLARLELEASVQQLVTQLPGLQLAAEPTYQPAFVIRGLESLTVAPS